MTETFQIGDKVTALGQRPVTITYGPFMSTFDRHEMYVAADGAGREHSYQTTDLKARPAFAVGDDVRFGGRPAKIAGGPVVGFYTGERMYLVTFTDGEHAGKGDMAREGALAAAPADEPIKVGDRIRVLKDGADMAIVKAGDEFTVTAMVDDDGIKAGPTTYRADGWYFTLTNVERVDEPPANTYTHDGVTYDLSAKYRDKDGDVWSFTGGTGVDCTPTMATAAYPAESLADVARQYAPLVKV